MGGERFWLLKDTRASLGGSAGLWSGRLRSPGYAKEGIFRKTLSCWEGAGFCGANFGQSQLVWPALASSGHGGDLGAGEVCDGRL